jgi:hypothetical protein
MGRLFPSGLTATDQELLPDATVAGDLGDSAPPLPTSYCAIAVPLKLPV